MTEPMKFTELQQEIASYAFQILKMQLTLSPYGKLDESVEIFKRTRLVCYCCGFLQAHMEGCYPDLKEEDAMNSEILMLGLLAGGNEALGVQHMVLRQAHLEAYSSPDECMKLLNVTFFEDSKRGYMEYFAWRNKEIKVPVGLTDIAYSELKEVPVKKNLVDKIISWFK